MGHVGIVACYLCKFSLWLPIYYTPTRVQKFVDMGRIDTHVVGFLPTSDDCKLVGAYPEACQRLLFVGQNGTDGMARQRRFLNIVIPNTE